MKIQSFEQYVSDAYDNGEFDVPTVEIPNGTLNLNGIENAFVRTHRQLGGSAVTASFYSFLTLTRMEKGTHTITLIERSSGVITINENDDDEIS